MVRLVAVLVILVIVLIVRFIQWLATPKQPAPNYTFGSGAGYGPGGPFQQRPPGYGPGYGPPQAGPFGGPPGMGAGYGNAPGGGYGAAPQQGYGNAPAGYGAAPQQGYGNAPAGYGAPAVGQLGPAQGQGGARLLARPDCDFNRLSAVIGQAGLQLAGPPGQPAAPGEPGSAMWQGPQAQIRYSFDPSTYTRLLEIQGPQAEQLRQHLQMQVG